MENSFFTAQADYAETSGKRFQMPLPNKEGAQKLNHLRIVMPGLVGIDYGAWPVLYYTHRINPSHLQLKEKLEWDPRVVCFGSSRKANAQGNWTLTEEGVLKCQSFILPSGVALHDASDVEQRFRVLVYLYNDGDKAIRGLRYWDHRVGSKSKGMYNRLLATLQSQVAAGYTPDDIIVTLEDTSTKDFANYDVKAIVPAPNSDLAKSVAFGDQEKEQVKAEAAEVLGEFDPFMDETDILNILRMNDEDKKTEQAVPDFNAGLAGPESGGVL